MSSLEAVYDEGGRRWAVVRAALLLAGSLVAVVGFVAATASLVAGFGLGKAGALKVATLLGGALLLGAYLVLFARGQPTGPSRMLASVGATFGVVGLALFWTTLPAGWTGRLAELPTLAAGTYAVGLLSVFAAGFAGESDGRSADRRDSTAGTTDSAAAATSDSLGGVETMVTGTNDRDGASRSSLQASSPASSPSSAVGDGGADEADLEFFDDEDA